MDTKNKQYVLRYDAPASKANDGIDRLRSADGTVCQCIPPDDGWERWSLPIGNGYLGVCVFGRTDTERLQITENSFANPFYEPDCGGGLNNLAELWLDFGHSAVTDYERRLHLNTAVAQVRYQCGGVNFEREYFASYPARVIAVKLTADRAGALSFRLRAEAPFVRDYCVEPGDGMGKTGSVSSDGCTVTLQSELTGYRVIGELQATVVTDGGCTAADDGSVAVDNASKAFIYIAAATNYRLESRVFTEDNPAFKLQGFPHPHQTVCDLLQSARGKGYDALLEEHIADYQALFGRVSLNLGGEDAGITTDRLLARVRGGQNEPLIDELIFQYGRYLLISSSRKGALPANLQGVWNRYADPPWSSGYWHNINQQMNYWLSAACNLPELFWSYLDYFEALLPLAKRRADEFIRKYFPENDAGEGENGWAIGTGAWGYDIYGISTEDHSGPGTVGFTALLFWDHYDFTRDSKALRERVYPLLHGAAVFLSKIMVFTQGKWLIRYSASPEQWQDGKTYRTVGCSFDQQMCFEVFRNTLTAAEILGISDDPLLTVLRERLPLLDPYPIGESGQIKEFREEKAYGEIGEKHHRHVSHLLGVYPGTGVSPEDTRLLGAVRKTLTLRGIGECGWSAAHRACLWARIGDGDGAYRNLENFKRICLLENLWCGHSHVYQIDGNFGVTAAIAEMLLQSDNGLVRLIPALPSCWQNGSFSGLCARGGFVVDAAWQNGRAVSLRVCSAVGGTLRLALSGFRVKKITSAGKEIAFSADDRVLTLETEPKQTYTFEIISGRNLL